MSKLNEIDFEDGFWLGDWIDEDLEIKEQAKVMVDEFFETLSKILKPENNDRT